MIEEQPNKTPKRTRTLKKEPCSNCGKLEVNCSNLCRACYSKAYRNTPKGKVATKLWNDGKGKDSQKRYLEKKNILKPPKKLNENIPCECGAISKVKGFCYNCYQRDYQRKHKRIRPNSGETRKKRQYMSFNKNRIYNYDDVLLALEYGFTIKKACLKFGLNFDLFYTNISEEQKIEIKEKEIFYQKKFKSLIIYEEDEEVINIDDFYDFKSMISETKKAISTISVFHDRAINHYSTNGELICKYKSIKEASNQLLISYDKVWRLCNKRVYVKNLILKYETIEVKKNPLDGLLWFLSKSL